MEVLDIVKNYFNEEPSRFVLLFFAGLGLVVLKLVHAYFGAKNRTLRTVWKNDWQNKGYKPEYAMLLNKRFTKVKSFTRAANFLDCHDNVVGEALYSTESTVVRSNSGNNITILKPRVTLGNGEASYNHPISPEVLYCAGRPINIRIASKKLGLQRTYTFEGMQLTVAGKASSLFSGQYQVLQGAKEVGKIFRVGHSIGFGGVLLMKIFLPPEARMLILGFEGNNIYRGELRHKSR